VKRIKFCGVLEIDEQYLSEFGPGRTVDLALQYGWKHQDYSLYRKLNPAIIVEDFTPEED